VTWPLDNLIRPTAHNTYRRVTNLLLQVRRARYVLQRRRYFKLRFCHDGVSGPGPAAAALFYALRTRLVAFTNGVYNYLMTTVSINRKSRT
jgi:gamma-tubulin complex component 5